ncbi:MAG: nuclear transport factor 2 family protein [Solirubrobacterales bacterium]
MSDANRQLIERLYAAFGRSDGEAMAACYTPDAHFRDPAFGDLEGPEVGAMWRMLTGRATDLSIQLRKHRASDEEGTANWRARYTFNQTGRLVENDVQASFRFRDGLIADHLDDFDLGAWARQALGLRGVLVSLLPPLRAKARERARTQLEAFIADERTRA